MKMTRARALGAMAALAWLPAACARRAASPTVRVGSKNFTEELLLGEMYAQLLEHNGLPVQRKLNLGGTQIAFASLQRGEIDLYPEYTGTGLLAQLHMAPLHDAAQIYATVKREYERRYRCTWLKPAPMNDTQALAVTAATSAKLRLRTLSDCARLAPKLRLGAVTEFTERPDGLPGLRKAYGGFGFASVTLIDIGLKYKALINGQVDVVVAFSTDGEIDANHLVVLEDDKRFFPIYQVAPVVRDDTLARDPRIRSALDPLAPLLTNASVSHLNARVVVEKAEPADAATEFLRSHGLV